MKKDKYIFIDRDGTLIEEPKDRQVDSIEKLSFMPHVFESLNRFRDAGYKLVMISNQDGLGSGSFPEIDFKRPQNFMLKIFKSQGIEFDDIKICPHLPADRCNCRKPEIGLLQDYLVEQRIDRANSYVVGDRDTDLQFAENLKLPGFKIGDDSDNHWRNIASSIIDKPRCAKVERKTNETDICVSLNLDTDKPITIRTGIGFFDHMLEQVIKHAGFSASMIVKGDLEVDDHHMVEDTAIVLGTALKSALGDKLGIARYGFVLPMDESLATVNLDLSGRSYCDFKCNFNTERIGDLSTEMMGHFFRSFADALQATLHVEVKGSNSHHMAEAAFKGLGRVLRQAVAKDNSTLPSTKGVL